MAAAGGWRFTGPAAIGNRTNTENRRSRRSKPAKSAEITDSLLFLLRGSEPQHSETAYLAARIIRIPGSLCIRSSAHIAAQPVWASFGIGRHLKEISGPNGRRTTGSKKSRYISNDSSQDRTCSSGFVSRHGLELATQTGPLQNVE